MIPIPRKYEALEISPSTFKDIISFASQNQLGGKHSMDQHPHFTDEKLRGGN